MPKRFSSIDRQRLSLSNILQRLPLHRQLNESQSFLLKLMPAWQEWQKTNFTSDNQHEATPANYQAGVLSIACQNAVCASQIKHQQTSLLEALHKSGFGEIKKLKIRVTQPNNSLEPSNSLEPRSSLESSNSLEPRSSLEQSKESLDPQQISAEMVAKEVRTKATQPSLKSIENCQKTISNERLVNSLNKLAETLKKAD